MQNDNGHADRGLVAGGRMHTHTYRSFSVGHIPIGHLLFDRSGPHDSLVYIHV